MSSHRLKDIIVVVNVIQLFFISIFTYHIFLNVHGIIRISDILIIDTRSASGSMLVLLGLLTVTTLIIIHKLNRARAIEAELENQVAINKASQETILLLRCHRHDFLNHLQVVMGYLQMGRISEALDYIKGVNNELLEIRRVSSIKIPEIAVMLLVKKEEAMRHNINLLLNIKTDLAVGRINKVDITRILTNLIDNAIHELSNIEDKEGPKIIEVTLDYHHEKLYFAVYNNLVCIEDTQEIFKQHFTTKREGQGLGLYIVSKLVNKYKGQISVDSNEQGTTFNIAI